jgi:hypothetical protein
MTKNFWLVLVFASYGLQAQVSNNLGVWVDHLPYSNSVDIEEIDGVAYVATEQGLYFLDLRDRAINRISKVNGLSDVGLSCLAYTEKYNLFLIGYQNGNLDILENGNVTSFPDLRLSSNYSGLKRINHIHVLDSVAFIATDFGILAYDLEAGLIRESPYIIGPNGTTVAVKQVVDDGQKLYAATDDGLYSADLDDAKFFFGSWSLDASMSREIDYLAFFDNKLFVNRNIAPNGDSIWYREGTAPWTHFTENEIADNKDLRNSKETLVIVNNFSARAYDSNFEFVKNWNSTTVGDTAFSPVAAVMGSNSNNFWIADAGSGIYQVFQIFPLAIVPNSPRTKNSLRMQQQDGRIWVAPGGLDAVGTPVNNNDGLFSLVGLDWTNIENASFGGFKDIVDIVPHPLIANRIYASSFGKGILELEIIGDEVRLLRIINEASTNGILPSIGGSGDHRVADMEADIDGNIWFGNAITEKPLAVIRPDGSVEAFSLGSAGSGTTVLKILVSSEGQIWQQVRNNGILVSRLEDGVPQETARLSASEGSGNLPSETVLSFAEDQDGEIWIGTNEGLAVLFSPENIFEPNRSFDASIIVIDEDGDGNGERVLGSQAINDIEIDGANKKWFGTANSGVFYTNSNGRVQLQRFSKENSPLASNLILDIEIDDKTGMVYFGTDQGIVSYQGQATAGEERMSDVFAYPNPVEPGYEGPILIRGLVTNAQVKITDLDGNIVFETVAEGGQAIWNGLNFSGLKVASGIYLAYITDDLGLNTEVTKIMILN